MQLVSAITLRLLINASYTNVIIFQAEDPKLVLKSEMCPPLSSSVILVTQTNR